MRFSIWPDPSRPFAETLEIVRLCEGFGWHAAYYADHFMPNGPDATPLRGDVNEATTTLAALAAQTTTIRLGTLVAAATYRHPAVAAKSFATIDQISNGRAIVGLGAGWQENEHASYGIELGTIKERIDRFHEYVAIVRGMLADVSTTFRGEYFTVKDAPCDPRPIQDPPPILLGVRGAKRTMRLAAQSAELWNAWTDPADLRDLNALLDRHCAELDRDPKSLGRTTQALVLLSTDEAWLASRRESAGGRAVVGTPAEVLHEMAEYRDAGAEEFIVPTFTLGDRSRTLETLHLFHEQVVTPLG